MYHSHNYLFYEEELASLLGSCLQNMNSEVERIPEDQFLATPIADIINHIQDKLYIEPLIIYEDKKTLEKNEVRIDVSGDRDRWSIRNGRQIYVPGIQVVVTIPFTGDYREYAKLS